MRTLRVMLLLLVAPTVLAQTPPAGATTEPAFQAVTGAFFALSVPDIAASTKWYSDKLGLAVVLRPPRLGKTSAVVLEGGRLIVELIQNDDATPAGKDPNMIHGIMKTGLVVVDLDRTVALLKARGVPIFIGPFPPKQDMRANFIVKDNAGNMIQFFGGFAR